MKVKLHHVILDGASKLVGSIDQGTSSTRFLVFTEAGQIAAEAQIEHTHIWNDDNEGWHEHDPAELWSNTKAVMQAVAEKLPSSAKLAAIGLTNQRETTIAWNKSTGKPYYNAIVWDDTRTTGIAGQLTSHGDNSKVFRDQTGLPIASYFAGTKCKWLLDNVPELTEDLDSDQAANVCFGTVDSWLLYQLTGSGSSGGKLNVGGIHVTDVSNASRWLFMDLSTQEWDPALIDRVCAPHYLPLSALPKICPSSHVYGKVNGESGLTSKLFEDVPLASILGDQQAALFGQTAFSAGEAKNTYGTGLFLMMNTGTRAIPSTHGLLTTVAFQIGDGPVHYALEGSVSHSGSTIQWLRDQLHLIDDARESETYAAETKHNAGLYFVPAFAGLFAPHWRSDARACIVGMTASHHRGHICRAALEATAYQTKEVFDAIAKDSNVSLKTLNVDGGGTANRLMMQFQADMIGVDVVKPLVMETTALGAAFAAGLAVGVWKDLPEIKRLWAVADVFKPTMSAELRAKNWAGWKKAISRSLGWVDEDTDEFQDTLQVIEEKTGLSMPALAMACIASAAFATGFLLGRSRR